MSTFGRMLVPAAIAVAFAFLRRFVPAPPAPSSTWTLATSQTKERLAPGVIILLRVGIALCILGSYFAFKYANQAWAALDGPQVAALYASSFRWLFFPLFGVLSIPFTLTLWFLRRSGRTDEADAITEPSDAQTGFNTYRLLNWFSYGSLAIAFFTLLALPIHLTVSNTEIRRGYYATLQSEVFPLAQVTRAFVILNTRKENGSLKPASDLILDFADGRRLDLNPGDPGDIVPAPLIVDVLNHIPVTPITLQTAADLPSR